MESKIERIFFKECFITDIIKYDAVCIWDEIKIGKKISLRYEADPNLDDGKKVLLAKMVECKNDPCCIGRLSDEDSKIISQIIKMGWENVFTCYVSYVTNSDAIDQRIKVAIYIEHFKDGDNDKNKEEAKN